MSDLKITSGVAKFDGAITAKWYAYADVVGGLHLDGPFRMFKWRARLDRRKLVERLRQQTRSGQ